jgi:alpha-glucosidase
MSNDPNCGPDDFCYLNHIHTLDLNETYEMVYQWRALLDEYKQKNGGDTKIILTEAYRPLNLTFLYYSNGQKQGSHVPFNFELIKYMNANSTAEQYKTTIESWLNNMPKGYQANWVVSKLYGTESNREYMINSF